MKRRHFQPQECPHDFTLLSGHCVVVVVVVCLLELVEDYVDICWRLMLGEVVAC